jgi:anthranilate synthase/aminodeoxychorismate synthase-like glutamine amidotransferase
MMKKLLLIDHHDSFTYLINSYFEQLQVKTQVVQYDDPILQNLESIHPDYIVFSPGPGHPNTVVNTIDMIRKYYKCYPMLGICLGMQCMAMAFHGRVVHASQVVHGKQSSITHTGLRLFKNIPSTHRVTRYHSLMVEEGSFSTELSINAWTHATTEHPRIIMGIEHQTYPVFGVQYHPEAILSEHGLLLFSNFLQQAQQFQYPTWLAKKL